MYYKSYGCLYSTIYYNQRKYDIFVVICKKIYVIENNNYMK